MTPEHRTEAACLLEQGALYRRRIGLESTERVADPIFAGFKRGAFSIYFGDAPIYHFDLEGRWQRAYVDGLHYLKGLDGSVQAIDRVREGACLVLERRTLTYAEASDFDADVRSMALELIACQGAGRFRRLEPPSGKAQPLAFDDLRGFLEQIGQWDAARWFAHRERYLATYGPLPFMPPECVNAVVFQATLGHQSAHSFGLSTTAEYYVRSGAEFDQHARDVTALWGRRLLQSHVVFMAGADVLRQPPDQIVRWLETVGRTLPIEPRTPRSKTDTASVDDDVPRFDGVHAFLDNFVSPRPDQNDFHAFAACGLVRVSLGVESGDPDIRALYRKNWANDELVATVTDAKAAGFGVSVLTLVGAGGAERAGSHVGRTSELIDTLPIGAGDFVFLLDEREIRDPSQSLDGFTPLHGLEWSEQQVTLKNALTSLKQRGVKVLPYTMEKQWT